MLCWNDTSKDVRSCIFGSNNYNITNIQTHLMNQHKSEKLNLKDNDRGEEVNNTIIDLVSSNTGGGLAMKSSTAPSVVLDKIYSLLYKFFNSANIAIKQADNKFLNDLLQYIIENGHLLKGKKLDVAFSRYKYKKQEYLQFHMFVCFVKLLLQKAREYYRRKCMCHVPFLCVSHDGWDSKDHDMLGVSLHFVVPEDWVRVNIAVGLKRVESKTSENTVLEINKILQR